MKHLFETLKLAIAISCGFLLLNCNDSIGIADSVCETVELKVINPNAKLWISHRGIVDLYPENSEEGLLAALEYGANSVELDVILSADQVPVVMHDYSLDRMTNCSGDIRDMNWSEISPCLIDGKYKVPRLDELLPKLNEYNKIFVELKTEDSQAVEFAQVIGKIISDKIQFHKTVVTSFNLEVLYQIKTLFPYPRIHLAYDGGDLEVPLSTLVMGFDYMLLNTSNADICMYAMSQQMGVQLVTYTLEPGDVLEDIHMDHAAGVMFDYIEAFDRNKEAIKNRHNIQELTNDKKCEELGGIWNDYLMECEEPCTEDSCKEGFICNSDKKQCVLETNPYIAIASLFNELASIKKSDQSDENSKSFSDFLASTSPYFSNKNWQNEFLSSGKGIARSRITADITSMEIDFPYAKAKMPNGITWHLFFEKGSWKVDYFDF